MTSLPKKADKLPASECQKTKHSLSHICVHCEEIYNKKKGRHADAPGLISLKVIPSAAVKGGPKMLPKFSQLSVNPFQRNPSEFSQPEDAPSLLISCRVSRRAL